MYTQNIDGLEAAAGLQCGGARRDVVLAHGTLGAARCTSCGWRCGFEDIAASVRGGGVPRCVARLPDVERRRAVAPRAGLRVTRSSGRVHGGDDCGGGGGGASAAVPCMDDPPPPPLRGPALDAEPIAGGASRACGGVMRPCVVFFNEAPDGALAQLLPRDAEACDLLLVMGTSLEVTTVSAACCLVPASVPRVLINATPVRLPAGWQARTPVIWILLCHQIFCVSLTAAWPSRVAGVHRCCCA